MSCCRVFAADCCCCLCRVCACLCAPDPWQFTPLLNARELELSQSMIKYWTSFAATGVPQVWACVCVVLSYQFAAVC
jgi:hypothetical protein